MDSAVYISGVFILRGALYRSLALNNMESNDVFSHVKQWSQYTSGWFGNL